jgi:hypothetical protein
MFVPFMHFQLNDNGIKGIVVLVDAVDTVLLPSEIIRT